MLELITRIAGMEIVSIKKNCECRGCGKLIPSNSKCYIKVSKSKGGPFLEEFCLNCGGELNDKKSLSSVWQSNSL